VPSDRRWRDALKPWAHGSRRQAFSVGRVVPKLMGMLRSIRFRFVVPLVLALTTACATTKACPGATATIQIGMASFYASRFHGRSTASGKRYDERGMTAAHRTLPFGTRLRVTNLANSRSVVVTVTDRGPFRSHRLIDVSRRAARKLGFERAGTARVRVEILHS
jgi:rare lipoprotein A